MQVDVEVSNQVWVSCHFATMFRAGSREGVHDGLLLTLIIDL